MRVSNESLSVIFYGAIISTVAFLGGACIAEEAAQNKAKANVETAQSDDSLTPNGYLTLAALSGAAIAGSGVMLARRREFPCVHLR